MFKKVLISILLLLPLVSSAENLSFCNWDFDRAHKEQLPLTYCFDRPENTFGGFLSRQCEGESCPVPNNAFTFFGN